MTTISGLKREADELKNRLGRIKPTIDEDYAKVLAMDACTETELGMVNEWYQLRSAGFTGDQIREMVGQEQIEEIARIMQKLRDEETRLLGEAR